MSSTALEFGLINTFRTGHVLLDAVVCMLVPLLIQRLTDQYTLTGVWATLVRWLLGDGDDHEVVRQIETKQRFNEYGLIWDGDQRNALLQKAVALYLANQLQLKGEHAKVELVEKPKVIHGAPSLGDDASSTGSDTASDSSDDGYESDDYDYETRVYRGEVFRLTPTALPPLDQWIDIESGVEFLHEVGQLRSDRKDSKVSETTTIFSFRSSLPDASERIDAIVHTAFAQYQQQERQRYKDNKTRYLYLPNGTRDLHADEESAATSDVVMAYKRYALSDDKSFENLFFHQKDQVVSLLDDFTHKTGKFGIKGFPFKLGLLLHGPPGTGKTSLIKAVAHYTKRHIVTINLAQIQTNQELMDAVFDLRFAVDDQDWPEEYTFKDVVFVMEDVDCASNVVASRQSKPTLSRDDRRMAGPLLKPRSSLSASDKLNLSGLLNVLDGVVDCPGRIVILTTNHPEKLDPALIRPGRVNKQLLLDYMGIAEMRQMIEYFCCATMTLPQYEELERMPTASGTTRLSPAEVEEICAEFDDMESVLQAIQRTINGEHRSAWASHS